MHDEGRGFLSATNSPCSSSSLKWEQRYSTNTAWIVTFVSQGNHRFLIIRWLAFKLLKFDYILKIISLKKKDKAHCCPLKLPHILLEEGINCLYPIQFYLWILLRKLAQLRQTTWTCCSAQWARPTFKFSCVKTGKSFLFLLPLLLVFLCILGKLSVLSRNNGLHWQIKVLHWHMSVRQNASLLETSFKEHIWMSS